MVLTPHKPIVTNNSLRIRSSAFATPASPPGAKIIIFGAAKKEDGTLEAARVNVGRNGITPPM